MAEFCARPINHEFKSSLIDQNSSEIISIKANVAKAVLNFLRSGSLINNVLSEIA